MDLVAANDLVSQRNTDDPDPDDPDKIMRRGFHAPREL